MSTTGYHFSAKTISRSRGQSAVAAVAYRTGERVLDRQTGEVKDFRRKHGVEFVYHATPATAPAWAKQIETAWNEVERVEHRKIRPSPASSRPPFRTS